MLSSKMANLCSGFGFGFLYENIQYRGGDFIISQIIARIRTVLVSYVYI